MLASLRRAVLVATPVAAFLWLYSGVLIELAGEWDADQDRAHGVFIIPISLYLAWRRREALRGAALAPSPWIGGAVLAAGLGMLAVGSVASQFLARVSILPTITGVILVLCGGAHLRMLAFAVSFLALMIPPPGLLYNVPVFKLQLAASGLAEGLVTLTGLPVLREGNVIVAPAGTFEVVAACSGVRSLVTLVTIGVLYGYLTSARVWIRVLLVAATIPIVVLVNGIRVGGSVVLAHYAGAAAARGFFHFFAGIVVFVITLAILALVHDLLERTGRRETAGATAV
jgi:exosortase